MLVWKSKVATGDVPTAAIILVVGGDTVVGYAIKLLLRGSGYDARFATLSTFDEEMTLRDADLILLSPGLDERGRGAVLASNDATRVGGELPLVELVPATTAWPREGHVLLPWPCRPEDLEREVEAALCGTGDHVGRVWPAPEERSTAHD